MPRLTVLAVAATLSGVFCAGPVAPAASAAPAHLSSGRDLGATRVAVVGDSYTTGSDMGGNGARGWAPQVWRSLGRQGFEVAPEVAAEGGAGYGTRGNRGDIFEDLVPRAVRPDDSLVVFYGSRNDQNVDPAALTVLVHDTLAEAAQIAPNASMLVLGPPWPTADVPPAVLQIRDILAAAAATAGAVWVDPIAEQWFVGRPDLIGRDGVHPTDAGHTYMAQRIAPLIAAQLTRPA